MTVPSSATSGRRTRVFIDYWNFQLSWNHRTGGAFCDWKRLPLSLVTAAAVPMLEVGLAGALELEETLLYASVDPQSEAKLRGWLEGTVERFPSYRVSIRERHTQPRSVHCKGCGHTTAQCPECGVTFVGKVEKGVDTAIATDLLTLAWQRDYDVAVLVTSDADFVPAVERIQERGLKVINAGWQGKGHELKKACWAAFEIDSITDRLRR